MYIIYIIIRTIKAGGDNRVNQYPDPGKPAQVSWT